FFFQAEDGIRDLIVTGVQTCALPISRNTMPLFSTAWIASCTSCSLSRSLSDSSLMRTSNDSCTVTRRVLVFWPSLPKMSPIEIRSEERRVGKECRDRVVGCGEKKKWE